MPPTFAATVERPAPGVSQYGKAVPTAYEPPKAGWRLSRVTMVNGHEIERRIPHAYGCTAARDGGPHQHRREIARRLRQAARLATQAGAR